MHENRETSSVSPLGGRSGKAESRTPDMYAGEESDRVAVPRKPPDNGAQASAEVVEGRARTKENTSQSRTPRHRRGAACPRVWRVCVRFALTPCIRGKSRMH